MITLQSQELITLIASFLWPLTRLLGFIAIAPPFGNNGVPIRVKLALGIFLALIVAPNLQLRPVDDLLTLGSILILIQQFIIGMAMGFIVRLIFAGIEMAGEVIGLTMGLGFATFYDPQTHGRSSAIAQFLVIIATLLFLALDMHLALLEALVISFQTIPITDTPTLGLNIKTMAVWGEEIFKIALILSLPIIAALLITNIALGILTRAAPQLNLFGIGFPITIGVGFLMLSMILPYLLLPLEHIFQHALDQIRALGKL